jgi:predicted dehydrogenase
MKARPRMVRYHASMASRRNFLGTVASGLATSLAAPASVLGANERVRVGIIGPGSRGQELMRHALACENVEIVAAADVYSRRLEEARAIAPQAKTVSDYRSVLDDRSVDAVLIATPQHLHCEHFTAALEAGKHVYLEKTMAFSVEHAKKMRDACRRAAGRAVQIGHQSCASGMMADALRFPAEEPMGKITAIHMTMYRNTPRGRPQWARPVYPDMTPDNIVWKAFLGEAPERPFDANRYINWRFFQDYSGGNVYENMCHQIAFWYKALGLAIPRRATMTGGIYLWKDGREVPDTMCVTLEQPEEMLISWNSGFGNDRLGSGEDVLGTDGTIEKASQIRYTPQRVNVKDRQEKLGVSRAPQHALMEDFIRSVRHGGETACPFDLGFRVSIACRMAVESYRQQRSVAWDPQREEIV